MENVRIYKGTEPYLFISYSHHDALAKKIIRELDQYGYRLWYDNGIEAGAVWLDEIEERIKNCQQFVLLLSPNAANSRYVPIEVFSAYNSKKDIRVFCLEDTTLTGSLKLILAPIQHIMRSKYLSNEQFIAAVAESLDSDTREDPEGESRARLQLEQNYAVHHEVYRGLSTAYYGVHRRTQNAVFIKHYTLRENAGSHTTYLINELQYMKELDQCPFVPKIIDSYRDSENIFIVETWLCGKSMKRYLEENPNQELPEYQKQCVDWIIKTANILRYLHGKDKPIIHRDIKPHNLLIGDWGDIYLVDFGTCRHYVADRVLTSDEICLGTVGYAAPEQYGDAGRQTDPRTDIYGLGITFHHLLTGSDPARPPYDLHPLRYYDSRFHPVLEEIILKMTARNIEYRYQSAEEVIAALKTYDQCGKWEFNKALKRSNQRIAPLLESKKPAPKKKAARSNIPVPGVPVSSYRVSPVVPGAVPVPYMPPKNETTTIIGGETNET